MNQLIESLDPPAPSAVLSAARGLKYRDFLVVAIVINQPDLFPDNWVYVHDSQARVGRIQNFKNWSPDLVPDSSKTCLGMEYFCSEGDDIWELPDADLIQLAAKEIENLSLARTADVEDGCVIRALKAYPVYDGEYQGHLNVL